MKNLLIITGSILFICIIITSMFSNSKSGAVSQEKEESGIVSQVREESRTETSAEEKNGYLLKEYEKKVTVFENGNSQPVYISDVYVSNLPQADRELLKEGIYVEDRKALKRLIEDYCS